jgi:hypothetical protein
VITSIKRQKPHYTTLNSKRSDRNHLMNTATKHANLLVQVFLHVSTVYCYCDRPLVEEVMYPPHADWKDMIRIAENCDEHTLNILTPKYVIFYD